MSYKIVKKDEKTGTYIARIQVGGVVWFLKDKQDQVLGHGKYGNMLKYFKALTEVEKG